MARILLIEDHRGLNNLISRNLSHDHVLDQAFTLEEGQFYLDTNTYDVLILDLVLPDGDGLKFAQNFDQKQRLLPILFLTAETNSEQKLQCLQFGISDYLNKPFRIAELKARVAALIRKTSVINPRKILVSGNISLDSDTHQLVADQRNFRLNRKEFLLLKLFLENPDRVLSKELIVSRVWPDDRALFGNSLATIIASLRRKLGQHTIVTIKSQGYVLRSR